jgi:hypothetical protein
LRRNEAQVSYAPGKSASLGLGLIEPASGARKSVTVLPDFAQPTVPTKQSTLLIFKLLLFEKGCAIVPVHAVSGVEERRIPAPAILKQ